jgi:hypothetical protein
MSWGCGLLTVQTPRLTCFGAWSLLISAESIVHWLLLGCELSLYAPYEFHYIFWLVFGRYIYYCLNIDFIIFILLNSGSKTIKVSGSCLWLDFGRDCRCKEACSSCRGEWRYEKIQIHVLYVSVSAGVLVSTFAVIHIHFLREKKEEEG